VYKHYSHLFLLVIFWEKTGLEMIKGSIQQNLTASFSWVEIFARNGTGEHVYFTTENNVRKLQFDVKHRTSLS